MTNVIQLSTSRSFLIQQAVLNATEIHFPYGVQRYGVAHVLRKLEEVSPHGLGLFMEEVCHEYRRLTNTYREVDDMCVTDPDLEDAIRGAFHI